MSNIEAAATEPIVEKSLNQIDEEAWQALDKLVPKFFDAALTHFITPLKRAGRAVMLGIVAYVLASAQSYVQASPFGMGIVATTLSFLNLTKTLSSALLWALAALALIPPQLIQWLGQILARYL